MTTPAYKNLTAAEKAEADSRHTSYAVWAAIMATATESRTAAEVWEDPTEDESEDVRNIIAHWNNHGHIESPQYWGDTEI